MGLAVAVCLMTCDRHDYTQRTLETFAAHNDLSRFRLLHADDHSVDARVPALAAQFGFETLVQTPKRYGVRVVRTALVEAAASLGVNWVLLLENDIETLRPFPWDLLRFVARDPDVYTLRLYGRYKDKERRDPCLDTHKRARHQRVQWRPLRDAPEKSQIGRIHWSAQPAVTRIRPLLYLHQTGMEPGDLTVRVKKNVTSHMGVERTPDRRL